MRVTTPEISWHGKDPVYSVDLQPGRHQIQRLATGGVDKYVRIWKLTPSSSDKPEIEILSNLNRHTKSVNCVRFSPDGDTLASAGDDCVVLFWKLSESTSAPNLFQEDDDTNQETWNVTKTLRGHLEDIYDLCWSSDGRYMITGAVDNSAIIWDLQKDCKLALLNEHKSFVQGVAFDPLHKYVATLSTDRSCRVFLATGKTCINNIFRLQVESKSSDVKSTNPKPDLKSANENQTHDSKPTNETAPKSHDTSSTTNQKSNDPKTTNQNETKQKWCRMYHDDSMRSFFRRLCFSPDGEMLVTPAGCMEDGERVSNVTYVFTRRNFAKPVLHLPSKQKVTIAVRFSPVLYELRDNKRKLPEDADIEKLKPWEKYETMFCLPYRMIFAVATEDSVILYDTQQSFPFAHISRIHYHQLSDMAWSSDGQLLVISSTDGYVSVVQFDPHELGMVYSTQIVPTTKACFAMGVKGIQKNGIERGKEIIVEPKKVNMIDVRKVVKPTKPVPEDMEIDTTSRVCLILESSNDSLSQDDDNKNSDKNIVSTNEKSAPSGDKMDFVTSLKEKNTDDAKNINNKINSNDNEIMNAKNNENKIISDIPSVDNMPNAFKNTVIIDNSKTQPVSSLNANVNQPKRRIQLTTLSLHKQT